MEETESRRARRGEERSSPAEYGDEEAVSLVRGLASDVQQLQLAQAAELAAQSSARALLRRLLADLSPDHDTRFLRDYWRVLDTNNTALINSVTAQVMASVAQALAADGGACAGRSGVVLAAWLAAAVLWRAPPVPRAAAALRALLPNLTDQQIERVAGACGADGAGGAAAEALVRLSDAAPRSHLAALLQRAPARAAPHAAAPPLLRVRMWARGRARLERVPVPLPRAPAHTRDSLHAYKVRAALLRVRDIFDE